MAAETEARGAAKISPEFRETPNARLLAIRANQPGTANPFAVYFCAARRRMRKRARPTPTRRPPRWRGRRSNLCRIVRRMPNAVPRGNRVLAEECSSEKRMPANAVGRCGIEIDAEIAERRDAFGQQTFSAGFIDWGYTRIDERDAQAPRSRGNGGRKPGRAASDDQHVRLDRVFQIFLPSEENQFGAEAWAHCGQNAQGAGRWTPVLVDILQD